MKRIAIIPARGGSKRIPRKNIKNLCGKPIIAYVLDAVKESNLFDVIHVSTDSNEIATVVKNLGFSVDFMRAQKLSDDHTPIMPVLKWVLEQYKDRDVDFETIMQKTNNRTDKTFKEDVKNRYNKCIVSDYHKKQCDVAHIKPFSECKSDYDRYNPNNGLLLSSDIHKQFDMYLFTIHPETFEIIINEDVEDIEDYSIYQYNKKILNINKSSSSYLKYHYEQFKMHI